MCCLMLNCVCMLFDDWRCQPENSETLLGKAGNKVQFSLVFLAFILGDISCCHGFGYDAMSAP